MYEKIVVKELIKLIQIDQYEDYRYVVNFINKYEIMVLGYL